MPQVQGHEWTYVGGPMGALAASQRLAVILGPVGLSVLQQVMTAGAGAAVSRLIELAKERTDRARAEAVLAAPAGASADVLASTLAAVRETLGSELAGQVLAAVTGEDFRAWAGDMLADMRRDGATVAGDDPTVTGGEFMAALWEVGRANAVFR